MVTIKEAKDILKKHIPEMVGNKIEDWGTFYAFSNGEEGDMIDDDWKIDKSTGKITPFGVDEMSTELNKHPDGWKPEIYMF